MLLITIAQLHPKEEGCLPVCFRLSQVRSCVLFQSVLWCFWCLPSLSAGCYVASRVIFLLSILWPLRLRPPMLCLFKLICKFGTKSNPLLSAAPELLKIITYPPIVGEERNSWHVWTNIHVNRGISMMPGNVNKMSEKMFHKSEKVVGIYGVLILSSSCWRQFSSRSRELNLGLQCKTYRLL